MFQQITVNKLTIKILVVKGLEAYFSQLSNVRFHFLFQTMLKCFPTFGFRSWLKRNVPKINMKCSTEKKKIITLKPRCNRSFIIAMNSLYDNNPSPSSSKIAKTVSIRCLDSVKPVQILTALENSSKNNNTSKLYISPDEWINDCSTFRYWMIC